MTEQPHITARLRSIRHYAAAYADDLYACSLQDRPVGKASLRIRPTRDERKARYVLVALCTAISRGTLDSLVTAITPWMREQVARVDALTDGVEHDRLSAAVGEMGMADEDLNDLAALRLPDAYTGIGG